VVAGTAQPSSAESQPERPRRPGFWLDFWGGASIAVTFREVLNIGEERIPWGGHGPGCRV
jgi:hypothetical protein